MKTKKITPDFSDFLVRVELPGEQVLSPGERNSPGSDRFLKRFGHIKVPAERLQAELASFLQKTEKMLKALPAAVADYEIETIELALEITGSGQVGFLGTGGSLEGTGGVTLTLKRKSNLNTDTAR